MNSKLLTINIKIQILLTTHPWPNPIFLVQCTLPTGVPANFHVDPTRLLHPVPLGLGPAVAKTLAAAAERSCYCRACQKTKSNHHAVPTPSCTQGQWDKPLVPWIQLIGCFLPTPGLEPIKAI